jgi:Right handed beta helix region
MSRIRIAGVAIVAALAVPSVAAAGTYPPPANPGTPQKPPKGPFHRLEVCKDDCRYHTIQAAVNKAKAGDTVKVQAGTYHEQVKIAGASKRYLKLVGNPKDPSQVVIDGTLGKSRRQNGVWVTDADQVTINGFTAKHYNGNGFFVLNANGYTLKNLNATLGGVYGIYAFNSVGGVMSDSQASYNNDAGFYIGQTPPQTTPKRSQVTRVKSFGNVLGFSGTNMRYVTITKSQWFNNGTGLAPNALDSEKYAPDEDNVITDNDIFWNNFNYYVGAPFKRRKSSVGSVPYPVGVGVIIFGGRRNQVTNNRIYGNYLTGFATLKQILLKQADAADPVGNQVHDNQFGLGGADLNGRDLVYDGSGSDNCFGPNVGVALTLPADGSVYAPCPFTGANAFNQAAQSEAFGWAGDTTHEKFWIKHPHAAKKGYTPLEHYKK